jgi:hypothetical protein
MGDATTAAGRDGDGRHGMAATAVNGDDGAVATDTGAGIDADRAGAAAGACTTETTDARTNGIEAALPRALPSILSPRRSATDVR